MSRSNSLPDCLQLLNQQIIVQEILLEHHFKAGAMFQVILNDDFLDFPKTVIYDYLWALSDVVILAKNINERLLNDLIKSMP